MNRGILLHLFILFLFLWNGARGQREKIEFNHLTPRDGLSQSTGQAIFQDSEGLMWFGTQDGLNKYNGYEITVYKHNPDDPNSLSYNEIGCIYEDSRQNLWIGTLGGGLNLYDRDKDHFIDYTTVINNLEESLSNNTVWSVYEDSRGNLWVGTDNGLNLLLPDENKFVQYFSRKNDPQSISSNTVYYIYEDSHKNLWIGTDNGLNIMDRENETFTRFMHDPDDRYSVSSNHINTIYEDKQGNVWIGTDGGGLNYYVWDQNRFYHYRPDENDPNSISGNSVITILEDSRGVLWIGTENKGLDAFDRQTQQFYHFTHDINDAKSISNNTIYALYESKNRILWIGTYAGGINILDRKDPKFAHYKRDVHKSNTLSNNSVLSFLEDRSGHFWIGTDGGGLNLFDREKEEFFTFRHNPKNKNTIPSDVILEILEDRKGRLWLGTYDGGISRFNMKDNPFKHYRHDPSDPKSLSNDDVFELYEDRRGNLWIGTNGGGINLLDPQTGNATRYTYDPDDPGSLNNNDIRDMYEDSQGILWIGSYGGGLTRFDRKNEVFSHYDIYNSNLKNNVILDIHEDRQGNLWLGTKGGGLNLFTRETKSFIPYTVEDGLPNNVINGILEDDYGNLWLSTNDGLSRFDPGTNIFKNFGIEDGLQSREFNPGAAYKDSDGYMYFGGINGFNRFHPDSVKASQFMAPVMITGFQIFNKPVPIGGKDSPLEKHISQTDRLVLSYKASVLTFEYVALSFGKHKGSQFAYKLEGFDKDWNYVGGKRTATYTNLDPGEYIFRVKTSNNDGVWNEKGTSLAIVIIPPFWRTAWFYLLSVLFIAIVTFTGYRMRIRSITEQNRRLEQEVAAQTSELDQKNKELEEALAEKEILIKEIHHRVKNNLAVISGLLELQMDYMENEQVRKSLMESQLRVRSISMIHEKLYQHENLSKIDFDKYIRELVDIILHSLNNEHKHIDMHMDIDNIELSVDQGVPCGLILNELISNAYEHAFKGRMEGVINICIKEKEDQIQMKVSDNGNGLPEGFEIGQTGSLGLTLVQTLTRQLNGNLHFTNKKETEFIITFKQL